MFSQEQAQYCIDEGLLRKICGGMHMYIILQVITDFSS